MGLAFIIAIKGLSRDVTEVEEVLLHINARGHFSATDIDRRRTGPLGLAASASFGAGRLDGRGGWSGEPGILTSNPLDI
jgi:hypothetical protein